MPLLALLLLLFLSAPVSSGSDAPRRVVSTNLCTDQLLLMLADPQQIASVSHLALEPRSSYMADVAAAFAVNHARSEEIIRLQPDLVLAGSFGRDAMIRLISSLGYRVERFSPTDNLEQVRNNIRRMARLLGHVERGERLIREMDDRIRQVRERLSGRKRKRALFYQPRGYTSGLNTLQDEALRLAGWINVSAEAGIRGYGRIDLETLLRQRPEQFFTSPYAPGTESLAQRQLRHPALLHVTGGKPMISLDYRLWICGGPMIAEAVERLAEAHEP